MLLAFIQYMELAYVHCADFDASQYICISIQTSLMILRRCDLNGHWILQAPRRDVTTFSLLSSLFPAIHGVQEFAAWHGHDQTDYV